MLLALRPIMTRLLSFKAIRSGEHRQQELKMPLTQDGFFECQVCPFAYDGKGWLFGRWMVGGN
jgi:hypothetical protein